MNWDEWGFGNDKGGKTRREGRKGRAGDKPGAHGPARPSLSSAGPRGKANAKGTGPYPPLGAAAPQARGRYEAASGGSRRRTRSRRQGGVRAGAQAGTEPAGPRWGPQEAPARLQPARDGRRELLPGGFMAHSSRAPLRVASESAGLAAGRLRAEPVTPARRAWCRGGQGAPGSGLGAQGWAAPPFPARLASQPLLGRDAEESRGPRRSANLEPPQRLLPPPAGAAASATAGAAAGPEDAEAARGSERRGDARSGRAPRPPRARPSGASGADAAAGCCAAVVAWPGTHCACFVGGRGRGESSRVMQQPKQHQR